MNGRALRYEIVKTLIGKQSESIGGLRRCSADRRSGKSSLRKIGRVVRVDVTRPENALERQSISSLVRRNGRKKGRRNRNARGRSSSPLAIISVWKVKSNLKMPCACTEIEHTWRTVLRTPAFVPNTLRRAGSQRFRGSGHLRNTQEENAKRIMSKCK